VIAVRVKDPSGFNEPKLHEIATALMVRADLTGGKVLRLTSRGMKTALHAPDGWTRSRLRRRGLDAKAEVSKTQPQAWPGYGAFLLRKDFRSPGPWPAPGSTPRPWAPTRPRSTASGSATPC
jgi:alpha-L-rhamnosidase